MAKKLIGKAVKSVAMAVAAEVGVDIVKGAIPVVEKAIDAKLSRDKSLIQLPNVVHLNVFEAKEVLEAKGFVVLTTLAKADKKFLDHRDDSVVSMEPKPGKYELGTLIKLVYVDHDILEQAHEIKLLEKQKQEDFQKEVGKHLDNFGKEIGKHANNLNKEIGKHANNLNKEIGKNMDNIAKFVAKPFGKK